MENFKEMNDIGHKIIGAEMPDAKEESFVIEKIKSFLNGFKRRNSSSAEFSIDKVKSDGQKMLVEVTLKLIGDYKVNLEEGD